MKFYCPKCGWLLERDIVITEKELTVWRLISRGMSTKEIGDQLGIPDKTIMSRKHVLCKKLDLIGKQQLGSRLTRLWIERGMQ